MTTCRRAALALMVAALAGSPVLAQEEDATPAAAAPMWRVSCSNQAQPETLICELSQSIIITNDSGQSRRIATASFQRAAGETAVTGVFTLPTEVLLTAPAQAGVDDAAVGDLAWQSCDAQSCYATATVGDDWLQAMRAGQELNVSVAARNGQGVTFTFQLQDFTRTERIMP